MEVSSTMTMFNKCRHASPRLFDRIVMWLGFKVDLHEWTPYTRQYGDTLYFCRKCECGEDQVQSAGPMGDGKWRNVNLPFRYQWERDQFDAAKVLDT